MEIDVDARLVRISAREIPVTYVEFEILHRMLRDPTRVFTRAQLLVSGTGGPTSALRSVDIHISRLRKKTASARSFVIETVPHVGYRCRDDAVRGNPVAVRR